MPSIALQIKPSVLILGLYLMVAILVCISIVFSSIGIIPKLVLIAACVVWVVYIILRDILCVFRWSWTVLAVSTEGRLQLTNNIGQLLQAQLSPATVAHPCLTVVSIKHNSLVPWYASHSVVLTPWQVNDLNQFRQLRVWLKWWNHEQESLAIKH
jgi:ABC-type transport system involved in multi-copper enzyme maturation permease subunit